jgi:glucan phosphoethanolaminetransferase (alkaline phosphatase superfamily)
MSTEKRTTAANVVLWLAFLVVFLAVGFVPIFRVHHGFTRDAWWGLVLHLVRVGIFLSIGLLVESFLIRSGEGRLTESPRLRSFLHLYWILIMFLIVTLLVDAFIYSFAGYHFSTAMRVLFADGPAGVGQVIEATGLSPLKVLGAIAGAVLFAGLAVFLSKKTRNLSARWDIAVPRRMAWRLVVLCIALFVGVELLAKNVRNPFLWEDEIRSVPVGFSLLRPDAALSSLRVHVKPAVSVGLSPQTSGAVSDKKKPHIYIVVIESLRHDMLAPDTMPHLSAFARQGTTLARVITAGNVTHYSWYGLFCGNYPIYFDVAKKNPQMQGSLPIALLRQAGYRIHLLATPDTAYQNLEDIVFGPKGALLDRKYHPGDKSPSGRDRSVITELVRAIRSEPEGGTVRIVALDSTHYGYEWGPGFHPPFNPGVAGSRPCTTQKRSQQALETRYWNSVAWVDSLLGEFFDALKETGRLERSLVIITGDHGEAFWEHESGTHGSSLMSEQLEVVFAMHLPQTKELSQKYVDGIMSLMDVMPTVLTEVNVRQLDAKPLAGVPLQERLQGLDRPVRPRAALTFQGWNEHAFRFAVTYEGKRVLLELADVEPAQSQRLLVKQIFSAENDQELLGKTYNAELSRQCLADLPRLLDVVPFLELE